MIIRRSKIEQRTFKTIAALNAFRRYLQEMELLISNAASIEVLLDGPKWAPTNDDEVAEHALETRMIRELHDEVVAPTFRYSATVALVAIVERELKRFAENVQAEHGTPVAYSDLKGGLLHQIDRYMKAFHGFSISECSSYAQIAGLGLVRNCIVHCAGEPELFKDKANLLRLSSPARGLVIFEGLPIRIGSEFLTASQITAKDFFLDLLFYHRELQCLVAFELKINDFKPEYLGKMAFYLEALDRKVRKPHEKPSVGILLCKSKETEVVEYALSRTLSASLVAEYQTRLPDKKMLQRKLAEFYELEMKKDA